MLTREKMLQEYEKQGMMEKGTVKIVLEIPKAFEIDLYEKGTFAENKFVEAFKRVLSEVKYGNVPTIGRYERETLEMFSIAFGNAEVEKQELKASVQPQTDILDKIRAEVEARLCCDAVSKFTDGYRIAILNNYTNGYRTAIQDVLDILDKYEAESKGQESITEFADRCKECGARYGNYKRFAEWVADEIFDSMWDYNEDSFAEIACRKLEKLGLVKNIGTEWVKVRMKNEDDNRY